MNTTLRIAVIEDTLAVQENLRTVLGMAAHLQLVGMYASAEDALVHVHEVDPHVLIVDVNLPGMNGIEMISKLRTTLPDSQFMIYTVHDDDARVFEALRAGANGYLLKSASPTAILEAITELRAGGAPMSASVARRLVDHFRPPGASVAADLSDREQEVLALLAEGLLYKEIAERLFISPSTVKNHIHSIYEKLHVQTRTEAVNKYFGR